MNESTALICATHAPLPKRALVIEDDAVIRANILELLSEEGFHAVGADDGRAGIEMARGRDVSLVICDVRMRGVDGFRVLSELRTYPETRNIPFIFLTGAADRSDMRAGMNLGADDYVTKPFTRLELLAAVHSRLHRQDSSHQTPARARRSVLGGEVVVADPVMVALYDDAAKAAQSPLSVLVLGETGVGKEILARSVHDMSARRAGPFMALNCAALTESILESELFGHERGAFTGAVTAREGLFEAAAGGTVFLDEVGELPLSIQAKLLRVLEDRKVMRVGGRTPIEIDVRFVAATNRDLETAVASGAFREDLYYRLNGFPLTIPPLRSRRREVVPLALQFLQTACERVGRRDVPSLTGETVDLLVGYAWPGNVRELRNVIERAVVLGGEGCIEPHHLPAKLVAAVTRARATLALAPEPVSSSPEPARAEPARAEPAFDEHGGNLRREVEDLERCRIVEALTRCAGNQTAAAERLGISRRTLVTRLAAYALPRPRRRVWPQA